MKTNNVKYILYIILFIVFILIRISYLLSSNNIEDISFKSLAIANNSFPFGIIKQAAINDIFTPIYYFLIHFIVLFKNELAIKIFNTLLAFANVCVMVLIGKRLKNTALGVFLASFLILNHFFLYYTNLIAPYPLIFLIGSITIYFLCGFIKNPNKKTFNLLSIANCLLIFCDSLGILYVISELFILYTLKTGKIKYTKYVMFLSYRAFISFLIIFPILVVQYAHQTKLLISNNLNGIGFNISALYLMINEYITPFLSFSAPDNQTNSTIGMLYSIFLNYDFKSINSIKIIITLFYSSILPLILVLIMSFRAFIKNRRMQILTLIALINIALILLACLNENLDTHPIYATQFFITMIIVLGYGIFTIKDKLIRGIIIFCILAIQVINPEINAFNVTLDKKFATINPIDIFKKEFSIDKEDLVIMPYMGIYGKMYYTDLNILNFDYSQLQTGKKNSMLKNLSNKKAKTINKKNIHYLLKDYLKETRINSYIAKNFIQTCLEKDNLNKRIVVIVDKLNSKPISKNSIVKCANLKDYTPRLRKIDFRYADLEQNHNKTLFNAIKSKTLYNYLDLIVGNFNLIDIVEYKKIDNEYFKVNTDSKNVYRAVGSYDSDFAFLIFKNP